MNRTVFFFLSLLFFSYSTRAQFAPFLVQKTGFKKDSVFIDKQGGVGDGIFLNTAIINRCIANLSKKGGGVIVLPKGIWLSGPVLLKSNINLHLQRGALLQFSDDFNQYPLVKGNWEGIPQMRCQSPIAADYATNIAITGSGIIDGNGQAWRMLKKEKLTESQWKKLVASGGVLSEDKKNWYPSEKSLKGSIYTNPGEINTEKSMQFYDSIKDFLRPNLLVFSNCNKILLEGITFQNSPAWCLHPLMSTNITIQGIQVKNPWNAQNGDGLDLESCSNTIIEQSILDVGDDAFCMKSGRDAAGRKRNMPTKNVIIKHCTVYNAHGGFVIGSEMSGGVNNILVENCTFIGTDIGLRFKTRRGRGGVVENIYIRNIFMKDIPGEAILFDAYYAAKDPILLSGEKGDAPKVELKPVDEGTPQFRNFFIKNITCLGAEKAIFIRGLPEMHVKNIHLENLIFQANQGMDIQAASKIEIKNIELHTRSKNPVVSLVSSDNIAINNIDFDPNAAVLLKVNGAQNKNIVLIKNPAKSSMGKVEIEANADEIKIQ